MKLLQEKIKQEGRVLKGNVLKVDAFLNHQVDVFLMQQIGKEFVKRFSTEQITKVLTLESSGIAPAAMVALELGVPLLVARKCKSLTLTDELVTAEVYSFTKQETNQIMISKQFVAKDERFLIIDDFLANGEAAKGLLDLVEKCSATAVGIGIVIEKSFQNGRKWLNEQGIHVESLARIASLNNNTVTFVVEEMK